MTKTTEPAWPPASHYSSCWDWILGHRELVPTIVTSHLAGWDGGYLAACSCGDVVWWNAFAIAPNCICGPA